MMMTTGPDRLPADPDDDALAPFLAAARDREPPLPDALLARVLVDAERLQPRSPLPAARRPARPGWRALLMAVAGGRGALAGMAAAGLAGVWIGFAQPMDIGAGLGLGTADPLVTLFPGDLDLWSDVLSLDPVPEG
jgi:hypothetical protein